jgi:hypothetical protein
VSSISASNRFVESHAPESGAVSVYDVGDCIKSWGQRGILSGAIFGFAFGAILVAIPLTTDVLTFGILGTLIVAVVECAAIAGGFGALAAALYGRGVRHDNATGLERKFAVQRRTADANWREEGDPLSAWPDRWVFPGPSKGFPALRNAGNRTDVSNTPLPGHGASFGGE